LRILDFDVLQKIPRRPRKGEKIRKREAVEMYLTDLHVLLLVLKIY
jgi:hypothetical protein